MKPKQLLKTNKKVFRKTELPLSRPVVFNNLHCQLIGVCTDRLCYYRKMKRRGYAAFIGKQDSLEVD